MRRLLIALLFCGICAGAVAADAPAVAILVQVNGEVALAQAGTRQASAPALVKLRSGDQLQLGAQGVARLVYFDGGRQETWKGRGLVEVGEQGGSSKGLVAEVAQVPALVAGQLKRTPNAGQGGRSAMIVTRAAPQLARLQKLQDEYEALRNANEPGAVLPELYYLNGLIELREYGVAKSTLEGLRGQPAYQPVVDLYGALLGQQGDAAR